MKLSMILSSSINGRIRIYNSNFFEIINTNNFLRIASFLDCERAVWLGIFLIDQKATLFHPHVRERLHLYSQPSNSSASLPTVADKSTPCTGRKPGCWATAIRSVTQRISRQPRTSSSRVAESSLSAPRRMAPRHPVGTPCPVARRHSTTSPRSLTQRR